jgi:uncharacterized protein (DUF58 family)
MRAVKVKKTRKRFRFRVANVSLAFTPFGVRTIIVSLLVGMAAVNTGSNLLYLCTAMLLSMMLVSGVISQNTLNRVFVRRSLPDEIYAGTPFTVRYEISNRKRRLSSFAFGVNGLYEGGRVGAPAFVLRAPARGVTQASAEETAGRRGRIRLSGYELTTSFPFGMFEKGKTHTGEDERIVYPKIRPLGRDIGRELSGGMGDVPATRKGEGTELRSLRMYQPADDARRIHWKSSARTGRLMTREHEAEQDRTVSVILDNSLPEGALDPAAMLEGAVSVAASAVRTLIYSHDLPVRLVTREGAGEAGTGRNHYLALMDRLALLNASDERSVENTLAAIMEEGPSILVLPSGGSGWAGLRGKAGIVLEAENEA